MIIKSDHKEATILGKSEVTTGTIALNAETFGLIIKGIYKDPLLASCREPIFNAVDAHVEAGRKDVPIKIHTPTLSLTSLFRMKALVCLKRLYAQFL